MNKKYCNGTLIDSFKIKHRNNTRYYIHFTDPLGRRIRKSLSTNLYKLAQERAMKIYLKTYQQGYLDIKRPVKITLEELVIRVLEYAKNRLKSYSKLCSLVKPLVKFFGGKYLTEITANLICEYQNERIRDHQPTTVNKEVSFLRRMFNLAIQWELIYLNPVNKIKFFKEPQIRIRFLTIEECNRLLECCFGYLKKIVLTALHTGMRKSEIFRLQWSNVDFNSNLIILDKTKNDRIREIPMSRVLREMLWELSTNKKKNDFVFSSKYGKPFVDIKKSFKTALIKAEIENFRFHDLRHTYASHLVMSGVDIMTVKELMGHKKIQTTLIYAHLAPKHKVEAIKTFEKYLCNPVPILCQK